MTIPRDQLTTGVGPRVGLKVPRTWLNAIMDAAALLVAGAIFAQLYDPDVLFHVIWVILTFEAFAFGLRVTAVRIGLAVSAILVYSWLAAARPEAIPIRLVELELSEWPLMMLIIVAVAVMADKVSSMGRHYAALYRQASGRLLTAQEDERRRLARDLHDGVGQVLTALTLTLDTADDALRTPAPATGKAQAALRRGHELAARALEETRGVAFRLRPARLAEAGLAASLRELARASGVRVDVVVEPTLVRPGLLAAESELEAFRIMQEALGNALRHALATRIRIELAEERDGLRIQLSDDGVGFDSNRESDRGLGLAGMRERAAVLGASLDVDSHPGRGTLVRLRIPYASRPRTPTKSRRRATEQASIT